MKEPGRYALVGLPCHIQGFRLARERNKVLRERIVFTIGLFCGWSSKPRATEIEALRAGLEPRELTHVSYRGPGWPGPLHYETRLGQVREWDLDAYFPRFVRSNTLLRCRLCPDALAELADISVGDAWLPRYAGSPGVSDLVVRTPRGQEIIDRVAPGYLTLADAQPAEIIRSQAETLQLKRVVYRGRMWLRGLARHPQPQNPGVLLMPSLRDRWQGLKDLAKEAYRPVEDRRFPSRGQASPNSVSLFTAVVSIAVAAFRAGRRRFDGR
jgi:coenzyme F420 hydrogenase subunit beta